MAKLAGIPSEVIKRAKEILAEVEAKAKIADASVVDTGEEDDGPEQMDIGGYITDAVLDDIRAADLNNMSPVEALNLLYDLQKRLK